jgi:hypothetical protein
MASLHTHREAYPQTQPYKWWNGTTPATPKLKPDPQLVKISDAGEAAFRKPAAKAKL